MFILAGLGAATAQSKHVLVLHSFGQHFKPWKEYAETIRAELNQQSPWVLDITDQSLVAARSGDENPEIPFVEYLRALFGKHAPDLIVSIGARRCRLCPAASEGPLCRNSHGIHGSGTAPC
jgi:hypothetical protein